MTDFLALILAAALFGLYFLPWAVALGKERVNTAAIGVANLFLGWTFIGWVLCLVWAMIEPPTQRRRY